MRGNWFPIALLLLVLVPLAPILASDKLTLELELKKQVFLLKLENAQLKAKLSDREQRIAALETVFRIQVEQQYAKDSQALSEECKALEGELRKVLDAKPDAKFDCSTLEFK